MNENLLKNGSPGGEEIALARYAAVSWVEAQLSGGGTLRHVLKEAAERLWNGRRFSWMTLERYYYSWRSGGYEALKTKGRSDQGETRSLSSEVQERLVALRAAYPKLTVTGLIHQLIEEGLLAAGQYSRSSIYRYLDKMGMDLRSIKAGGGVGAGSGPTKAFEFALANALWMTDMMYGPTLRFEDGSVRTRLFAFLDDCSRLCPHAQYYASESTECLLDVLRQAIERRGVPSAIYSDLGKVFTCRHLQIVCANLGIRLIHAKPYHCWSKGKIERFFLRVQQQFQQTLVLAPAHSLDELNTRFWQWLEVHYHQTAHMGIEGETPALRFAQRSGAVRSAPALEELQKLFLHRCTRRVRKDATVSLDGKWFEVSAALRGQMIEIHYNPFTFQQVEVYWQGKFFALAKPLDKYLNARTFADSQNYERQS